MIKTVCLDLDGTLLTSDKTILPYTKETLIKFQEDGGRVILASGRIYKRMYEYALDLQLDKYDGYIIEVNGNGIYHVPTQDCLFERRLTKAECEEVFNYLKQFNVEIMIMGVNDVFLYEPDGVHDSAYIRNVGMEGLKNREFHYIDALEEVKEDINKFCINQSDEIVDNIYTCLKRDNIPYWYGKVLSTWLEVGSNDTSKGMALEKVFELTNSSKTTCAAFGDGENDLSMLEIVECSVAMGNALDSVKQACQYSCDTNNQDGIAKFLNEMKEK